MNWSCRQPSIGLEGSSRTIAACGHTASFPSSSDRIYNFLIGNSSYGMCPCTETVLGIGICPSERNTISYVVETRWSS